MTSALKSPTCRDCARARGLRVPGDVHTVWQGRCANCGRETAVAPAEDWRRPGERVPLAAWD